MVPERPLLDRYPDTVSMNHNRSDDGSSGCNVQISIDFAEQQP